MSKRIYTAGLSTLTLIAGLAIAAPASAQLGGLTGSVGGTIDGSVRSSTDISTRTRATVRTPKAKVPKPQTRVRVRAGSPATVRYGTTRSGGYHSHGGYHYHTHTHGYDHFYDDHHHGHSTHVHIHGEGKTNKKAEVVYTKADLLTFGTPIRTQSGASMGTITTLQRAEDGDIIGITAGSTLNLIPVSELTVDGNILIHTLPPREASTKTKGEIAFEAEVEMVR
ncbi:hypothetical protein [Hellea balneolensis]|uniref:hypothetical protein n=1 Tax=Hellea balneolensis TaxID=287478 RepID=UPI000405E2EE|nr:hypothetical protein [Hellea balneolensis]